MYCKEIVCDHVDWIHLTELRDQCLAVLNTTISLLRPLKPVSVR